MPDREEFDRSIETPRPFGLARIVTLNCRDAAALTSAALDRRLSRPERVGLGLHRLICSACRRFDRQVRSIRAAMNRLGDDPELVTGPELSPAARSRLRDAIDRALRPD